MKVSIIIPVYNGERTIARCLDSVINQDFHDCEIIVIDDGSKDNTESVLKKYSDKNNIKIIKTENKGQSAARNLGLDIAHSDYICFLDADDYVSKDGLRKLYEKAVTGNFDVVVSDVNLVYPDHNALVKSGVKMDTTSIKEIKEIMTFSYSAGVVWNKIYKKEILDDIRFMENIWYEDVHFNFRLFPKLKSIGVINDVFVNYVQTSGSITYTYNDKLYDIIKVFNNLIVYYKKNGLYDEYYYELEYSYVRYAYNTFVKRLSKGKDFKKFLKGVQYVKNEVKAKFPKYRENYYYWHYRGIKAVINNIYFIFFNAFFAVLVYIFNKNKMN